MKINVAVLLTTLLAVGVACSEDPARVVEQAPAQFRALTDRDDVLFNLELAYNRRNIDQYAQLLDNNFIFNFSPLDIGNLPVAQWDRVAELDATRNIFSIGTLPPNVDPVTHIDLTLIFNDGADEWQEMPPPAPQQYPGETWYVQIVDYILTVQMGETTYTSGGPLKAEFVVRKTDDTGDLIWRIVSWRDLGALAVMPRTSTGSTKSASWGLVKLMYAPQR